MLPVLAMPVVVVTPVTTKVAVLIAPLLLMLPVLAMPVVVLAPETTKVAVLTAPLLVMLPVLVMPVVVLAPETTKAVALMPPLAVNAPVKVVAPVTLSVPPTVVSPVAATTEKLGDVVKSTLTSPPLVRPVAVPVIFAKLMPAWSTVAMAPVTLPFAAMV